MTFVMLDADTFKRAGRGRAKVGELRRAFEIHHTHVDAVSVDTWTCDELLKMASV